MHEYIIRYRVVGHNFPSKVKTKRIRSNHQPSTTEARQYIPELCGYGDNHVEIVSIQKAH